MQLRHQWMAKSPSDHALQIEPYFCKRHALSVVKGLVYWGRRVVVLKESRDSMLQFLQETYPRTSAMKEIARALFWWPRLDGKIDRLVNSCEVCVLAQPMLSGKAPVNWQGIGENRVVSI